MPGKDLGMRRRWKGRRWEAVGFPWPLLSERSCLLCKLAPPGSKNASTPRPMLRLFTSAQKAPPEAVSEYSQHFRLCGFWANHTPSLLSTINHIRIAAFINTGPEADMEWPGWYKTNQRKMWWATLKGECLSIQNWVYYRRSAVFKTLQIKTKTTTKKITPLSKKQNKIITGACFALEVYICWFTLYAG